MSVECEVLTDNLESVDCEVLTDSRESIEDGVGHSNTRPTYDAMSGTDRQWTDHRKQQWT